MEPEERDPRPNLTHREDAARKRAAEGLRQLFASKKEEVFFSRQLEVWHEEQFFHWVTNAAIHDLRDRGIIKVDKVADRGPQIIRNKSFRFYKRKANEVLRLNAEYSRSEVTHAVGERGEQLVQEAFVEERFVRLGKNVNELNGKTWTKTKHDMDFVFERDGLAYGVEVKNVLGYSDLGKEITTKIELCQALGIRPVFVARFLPKVWIHQVWQADGFVLLYKQQLYPPLLKDLARRLRAELGLPVEPMGALPDGAMRRFTKWHKENLDPERLEARRRKQERWVVRL